MASAQQTINVTFFPDRRHRYFYRPYNTKSIRFTSLNLTQSWGAEPGSAVLSYINADGSVPRQPPLGLRARIKVDRNIFWMILNADRSALKHDGALREAELVDYREYLKHDYVFCAFNMRDDNTNEHGILVRRYWHILPKDFNSGKKIFTNSPYKARQILDFLFRFTRRFYGDIYSAGYHESSPEPIHTIETEWEREYHRDLSIYSVYNLNWLTGQTLGAAITQISETLGLVFTLNHQQSAYSLKWARKGEGVFPTYRGTGIFPPNSFDRRSGFASSGKASRVRVIGGRNRYQVANMPAVPFWNKRYQVFVLNQAQLAKRIYDYGLVPGLVIDDKRVRVKDAGKYNLITKKPIDYDGENVTGWLIAGALSRQLTLWQYSFIEMRKFKEEQEAKEDKKVTDFQAEAYRRTWLESSSYKGQSRNNMPVWLYVRNIVFKSFIVHGNDGRFVEFLNEKFKAVSLSSCEVHHRLATNMEHNVITGRMYAIPGTPVSGDGYAVVQGYAIDAQTLSQFNPDRFNHQEWLRAQDLWQDVPFELDRDERSMLPVLIFGSAIIRSSDLFFEDKSGKVVLKAKPDFVKDIKFKAPAVNVCLSFDAEYFSFIKGRGGRDKVISVPNLKGFYISDRSTGSVREIPFSDETTVKQRALEIANAELNSTDVYLGGGYSIPLEKALSIGPSLAISPMFDRITLNISATSSIVQVDFTKERARNNFIPERDLDHMIARESVFTGHEQLKEEVNELYTAAVLVNRNKNIQEQFTQDIRTDANIVPLKEPAETSDESYEKKEESYLEAGSPVWKRSTIHEEGKTPRRSTAVIYGKTKSEESSVGDQGLPDDINDDANIFMGVTFLEGEDAREQIARTISQGDTLARVMCPIDELAPVGKPSDGGNFLVANGDPVVGVALETKEEEGVHLIGVRLGVSGGPTDAGGGVWK